MNTPIITTEAVLGNIDARPNGAEMWSQGELCDEVEGPIKMKASSRVSITGSHQLKEELYKRDLWNVTIVNGGYFDAAGEARLVSIVSVSVNGTIRFRNYVTQLRPGGFFRS